MTKPRDLATLGGGFTQSGTGAIVVPNGTFTTADAAEFTAALAVGLLDDIYTLS